MNSLRISTLALSLVLTITVSVITPAVPSYAHHINKNAPPGPIKKSTVKKKIVKKSIEEKTDKSKNMVAKKVDVKSTDKKLNVEIKKSQKENTDIKTVQPITAKPVVTEPLKPAPTIAEPVLAIQKAKPISQSQSNPIQNYEIEPVQKSSSDNKLNTLIENKKTQGAVIGSLALGAATANPIGLVLGGLGGYMVGKGEQAEIEYQAREEQKLKAVKPAPLQANYQVCQKMQKSRTRSNLPFCFYSME